MTAPEIETAPAPVRLLACGKPACSIDGCNEHAAVRGLCGRHDYRASKYGDPHWEAPPRMPRRPRRTGPPPPRLCIEDGCMEPTYARSRCQPHFMTWFLDSIPSECYSPT